MRDAIAYHLVPEPWYRAQLIDHPYVPELFDREGFVHLTHGIDPVIAAGNRYYKSDPRPYLMMTVDLMRVTAAVRYEDPANQFPHIYGPIDRDAIVMVQRVRRGADGVFLAIGDAAEAHPATD